MRERDGECGSIVINEALIIRISKYLSVFRYLSRMRRTKMYTHEQETNLINVNLGYVLALAL